MGTPPRTAWRVRLSVAIVGSLAAIGFWVAAIFVRKPGFIGAIAALALALVSAAFFGLYLVAVRSLAASIVLGVLLVGISVWGNVAYLLQADYPGGGSAGLWLLDVPLADAILLGLGWMADAAAGRRTGPAHT